LTRVWFTALILSGAQLPGCYESSSECPDLKEAVHALCGDENPAIENALVCFDEAIISCEDAAESIEPLSTCDEDHIDNIINWFSNCDPTKCAKLALDCPESPYYDADVEHNYDYDAAFGGCTTAHRVFRIVPVDDEPVWAAVVESLCHRGRCVSQKEAEKAVCGK
jgi:hypothetical protein